MKPLPDMFAMCCVGGDRWLVVALSERTFARTFDRTELRAVDSGAFTFTRSVDGTPAGAARLCLQRLDEGGRCCSSPRGSSPIA
jgi:hypothetical protein